MALNANTVLKAYRELEREGLVAPRPGAGTFVLRTPATATAGDTAGAHEPLRAGLPDWLDRAWRAGLDDDSIEALFWTTSRGAQRESGDDAA